MPDLIVLDLETTGLEPSFHVPVEIAAMNTRTGETLTFVPEVRPEDLANAEAEAMTINRYYERQLYRTMHTADSTRAQLEQLAKMLHGNTIGGVSPGFDEGFLVHAYRRFDLDRPEWQCRLADLSPITAGALGLDPTALPSLALCCQLLGVENLAPHTALGDVMATAACFKAIAKIHDDHNSTHSTIADNRMPTFVDG